MENKNGQQKDGKQAKQSFVYNCVSILKKTFFKGYIRNLLFSGKQRNGKQKWKTTNNNTYLLVK
jgi:hypothetical protein